MFWVASVVCSESNVFRRMKCIKHFIKIAKYCKEFKNFNSMFALLSGLGTGTVSRLRNTWEKLPGKYQRMFEELSMFLDPTRNMSKYRNLLNSACTTPPVIPIFPIVKKDLTFIELGNDTYVDGLVNFEKMRMIAKEVRHIVGLASSQYIPALMVPNGTAAGAPGSFFANLQSGNMSGVVTLRRKKRSSALMQHPKRMFEEAQMVRRVKAYLSNLEVIEDEEKLNEMSIACEGKAKNEPSTGSMMPSLSPSLTGPKFGAEGVNVSRLMALSEKSRPVQSKPNPKRAKTSWDKVTSPTPSHKVPAHAQNSAPSQTSKLKAVDLTSESSSVLGNLRAGGALRKLSTSSSISRSSTGSSQNKYVMEREEVDSGHHSMYDSHSQSSAASSQQPSPPSNITTITTTSASGLPSIHTRIHVPGPAAASKGQPPNYQIAAQMAYLSRHQPGSSHPHAPPRARRGAGSSPLPDRCNCDDDDDDDIEEVVSAV